MSGTADPPGVVPGRRTFLQASACLLVNCVGAGGCETQRQTRTSEPEDSTPDTAASVLARGDSLLRVKVRPHFSFRFDVMRTGVLQHVDRNYTYDVIPPDLDGTILFQGIHRPPKGTQVTIHLVQAARAYFFFHHQIDGGYGRLFKTLAGWHRARPTPQYDLKGGDHGRRMVMYEAMLGPGAHSIPPTTQNRACFSMAFRF